jgi:hypothetical protein
MTTEHDWFRVTGLNPDGSRPRSHSNRWRGAGVLAGIIGVGILAYLLSRI